MLVPSDMSEQHLHNAYPRLSAVFAALGPIEIEPHNGILVAEAITRIVIGQMLSRNAATSIYSRVAAKRDEIGLAGSWQLDCSSLVSLGLSRRKAQTIQEFGVQYQGNPDRFENWRSLSYNVLRQEVSAFWGLSDWSADMLAIFYFGLPDVFPSSDGTIKRAICLLEEKVLKGRALDPTRAKPYRTYLSLYLWRTVDSGLLKSVNA